MGKLLSNVLYMMKKINKLFVVLAKYQMKKMIFF